MPLDISTDGAGNALGEEGYAASGDDETSDDEDETSYGEDEDEDSSSYDEEDNDEDEAPYVTRIFDSNPDLEALRKDTLERNNRYINLGTKIHQKPLDLWCIGPYLIKEGLLQPLTEGQVKDFCPFNSKINWTTAQIIHGPQNRLSSSRRCIPCYLEYKFIRILHEKSMTKGPRQEKCSETSCDMPVWRQSKFCEQHYRLLHTSQVGEKEILAMQNFIRTVLPKPWEPTKDIDEMIKCLAGPSRLDEVKFLVLEYDFKTSQIFQIGTCDASGRKVVDCNIQMDSSKQVDTSNQTPRSGGLLDAHEVADRLKKAGVTPKMKFVTTNRNGLIVLRQYLEVEGYNDILLEDENCFLPLDCFLTNLRKNQLGAELFSCKLPALFPALFGVAHRLYGENHQAYPKALQLWLITKALVELLKSPEERQPNWLEELKKIPVVL